jgi:hypothetical protein
VKHCAASQLSALLSESLLEQKAMGFLILQIPYQCKLKVTVEIALSTSSGKRGVT